jgi:hypothetical protein
VYNKYSRTRNSSLMSVPRGDACSITSRKEEAPPAAPLLPFYLPRRGHIFAGGGAVPKTCIRPSPNAPSVVEVMWRYAGSSPDRAYGARVLSTARLEVNRRNN